LGWVSFVEHHLQRFGCPPVPRLELLVALALAHRQAEHSAAVVAKAIDAMGAINRSSEKVTALSA